MAPAWTLPTAKANLYTGLSALTSSTLSGVEVVYGFHDATPQREAVYIGDTEDSDQQWTALGGPTTLPRDEDYSLKLAVQSAIPGKTQQQATERACAIFAEVENYLRDNVGLGMTSVNVVRAEIKRPQLIEYPLDGDQGFAAVIESAVRIQARTINS